VILRDDDALVMVPLWHEGKKAAEVFREVWSCLELIRRATNYLCYDPQLGCMFEITAGEAAALARYDQLVRENRQALPPASTEEKPEPTTLQIRQLTVCAGREVVMVAVRENGGLSGFADVSIEETPANGAPSTLVACLKGWYVAPAFRGRGIGRRLRESAREWAVGLGVNGVTVEAKANDGPQNGDLLNLGLSAGESDL
jgi:aminoglycoside 6'-N-acetyltransferase I